MMHDAFDQFYWSGILPNTLVTRVINLEKSYEQKS